MQPLCLGLKGKVGLAVVDSNYRFISVNETLARYHGRDAADYPGRELGQTIPASVWPIVAPLYKHVIEYRSTIAAVEFRADYPAINTNVLCRASHVPTSDGGVAATIICAEPPNVELGSATLQASVDQAPLRLTRIEAKILNLLGKGQCTKEIASSLNISSFTVSTHRKHICKKLCVHSTAELISVAASTLSSANLI